MSTTTDESRNRKWRWVAGPAGERLHDVGILADGSLHNPNGYPEDAVRAAIEGAMARRHARASEAAKRAAQTRRKRQERRVYETAKRLINGGVLEPRRSCCICGKGLDDDESIERGIGSECWQHVMAAIAESPLEDIPPWEAVVSPKEEAA